jgi:hypothetical protein
MESHPAAVLQPLKHSMEVRDSRLIFLELGLNKTFNLTEGFRLAFKDGGPDIPFNSLAPFPEGNAGLS